MTWGQLVALAGDCMRRKRCAACPIVQAT